MRLTRAGHVAALLALVMLAAALNTGNNLLYLLSALVVAMLPVSMRLARASLASVSAELLLPVEVQAGDGAAAALRIRSGRRDVVGLRAWLPDGESLAVPFLSGENSVVRPLPLTTERRGPMPVTVGLDCLYPWGLMRARCEGPRGELLVLPKPKTGGRAPLLHGAVADGRPSRVPGEGQDLLEIRSYVPGDDARRIDWKATARRDRTMVRLGAREEDRRATVVIDPSPRGAGIPAAEDAISRAAGTVIELARSGWQVRLVHPGGETRGGELEQLRVLARLEVEDSGLRADWWRRRVAPGAPVVHCAAEETGS